MSTPTQTDPQVILTASLLAGSEQELSSGAKPLLLVGPSLGTGVEALWGPALPHLQESFHVIGWDLPGHGRSAPARSPFSIEDLADAVEATLNRVCQKHQIPDSTTVLAAGVSIAGAVSLTLALRRATRINRLAAICSAARFGTPQAWEERAELVRRAGTPTMVEGSAHRWFAEGFMSRHPEIATSLLASLQHADRHSYAYACRALGTYDLSNQLDQLVRPLLLVHGAEDQVCPPAEAASILQAAGEAAPITAVTLEGVAHQAPAEAPAETAATLKEFLDG